MLRKVWKKKEGSGSAQIHSTRSISRLLMNRIKIQHKSVSGFLFFLFLQRRPAGKWGAPWDRAMGCGGSRTDVLEPRYLESWTKETESTWLTSTDTDIPLSSIQSIPSESSEAGFTSEKTISPGEKATAEWTDEWTLNWSPLTGTGCNSTAEQINYTCVIV